MNKFLLGTVLVIIIGLGIYFLVDANADRPADGNGDLDEEGNQVENAFDPGTGEVTFILEDNGPGGDGKRTMEFSVRNEEDSEIELTFGTSMKYDFYIIDESSDEVYRDSDRKSYMQVIQEIVLEPDEKKTFELELPGLEPGDYTLTAILAADGYGDAETSIGFRVE